MSAKCKPCEVLRSIIDDTKNLVNTDIHEHSFNFFPSFSPQLRQPPKIKIPTTSTAILLLVFRAAANTVGITSATTSRPSLLAAASIVASASSYSKQQTALFLATYVPFLCYSILTHQLPLIARGLPEIAFSITSRGRFMHLWLMTRRRQSKKEPVSLPRRPYRLGPPRQHV